MIDYQSNGGHKTNRSNVTTIIHKKNNQFSSDDRHGLFSPRPSIDLNIKKMNSPNKSFLKKNVPHNMSTGNLASKYSSVDIEDLWNQAKPSSSLKVGAQPKIGVPKGTAKQYIRSLKDNGINQKEYINIRSKDKRLLNY